MRLSRREFLRLAMLAGSGAALSACQPATGLSARLAGPPQSTGPLAHADAAAFRILQRLSFGPRPDELARFSALGLPAWLDEQLAPEGIDDSGLELRLQPFDILGVAAGDIRDFYSGLFDSDERERAIAQLRQAALLRQVYSRRQLYEVMVEFWSDHFNISLDKGDCWYLKPIDDREVVRAHALGNFSDLLRASARSPAMLIYLDNQSNHAGAPNENYARELMELHTLGVGGGYTQRDVMELARCLTGWGVTSGESLNPGEFVFDPAAHDAGEKGLLGLRIAPAGERETEEVIEALIAHPSTARFIAAKLARRFIGEQPDAKVIDGGARAFQVSRGDIKATLRAILLAGAGRLTPKYKRPLNFAASSLRALDAQILDGAGLEAHLRRMGQPQFGWSTPDGYPDRSAPWQGALFARWQFAFALAHNALEGVTIDLDRLFASAAAGSVEQMSDVLGERLLGAVLPAGQHAALLGALDPDAEAGPLLAAAHIACPQFQWR